KPKTGIGVLVNVKGGEVALARSGDIEAQVVFGFFVRVRRVEQAREGEAKEMFDSVFAGVDAAGIEFAELLADVIGFEMDALVLVVVAAAFDGGPFDDAGSGGAEGVAHVGLLKGF